MRIRIFYEKTGLVTFINHMDMPTLFARAAKRAGLVPELTEGFSPHPRISMAAPLATGVAGMCEAADFWLKNWDGKASEDAWNKELPDGIRIIKTARIESELSMAKSYNAASYTIRGADTELNDSAASLLRCELEKTGSLCDFLYNDGVIELVVTDLERIGASTFVKILRNNEIIEGWKNVRITRNALGVWKYDEKSFCPLSS